MSHQILRSLNPSWRNFRFHSFSTAHTIRTTTIMMWLETSSPTLKAREKVQLHFICRTRFLKCHVVIEHSSRCAGHTSVGVWQHEVRLCDLSSKSAKCIGWAPKDFQTVTDKHLHSWPRVPDKQKDLCGVSALMTYYNLDQGGINWGYTATTWRAKQGPCELMSSRERERESELDLGDGQKFKAMVFFKAMCYRCFLGTHYHCYWCDYLDLTTVDGVFRCHAFFFTNFWLVLMAEA